MEATIVILAVVLLLSLLVNINQLRKQEAKDAYIDELETSNTEYYNFFVGLKERIGNSHSQLKQLDRLGAFESDDETGFIFKEMLDIHKALVKGFSDEGS
jgi:hypothetical protein